MQAYVYIVFRDNMPKGMIPTVWSVFRTRRGAEDEAAALNKAEGKDLYWASSVKVTQR